MARFTNHERPGVGSVRLLDERPNLAAGITEPRECTQVLRIAERQGRPVKHIRLSIVGYLGSGYFVTVKHAVVALTGDNERALARLRR
jgi:hypothetical protein